MSSHAEQFGRAVSARREALGLTHDEVRDRGGPSSPTLTKIEREGGPDTVGDSTFKKLDKALKWERGSARRLWLDGTTPREVEPTVHVVPSWALGTHESLVTYAQSLEERVARLERRVDGNAKRAAPIDPPGDDSGADKPSPPTPVSRFPSKQPTPNPPLDRAADEGPPQPGFESQDPEDGK